LDRITPPAALYRYSPDRKGERPAGHPAGYGGHLQADPYSGYEALTRGQGPPGIVHVACWAHARRKFFDVFEATRSPMAEEALRRIQALYAIEAEMTGKPPSERQAARVAQAVPILAELKAWLEEQHGRLLSKTALSNAMQYALTRWDALVRYCADGRLAIDNNVAERSLRGVALTRKNFLFLGSDAGGERAAVIYTVLETAKLNGLDPEAYLARVLERLAKGHAISRLDALLPWNWAGERARLAA
jgi:transposase